MCSSDLASLLCFETRVTHQPGSAAHQGDRTMTRDLETPKREERDQAPYVETVGRRVKPAIYGSMPAIKVSREFRGELVDQTARGQIIEKRQRLSHSSFSV